MLARQRVDAVGGLLTTWVHCPVGLYAQASLRFCGVPAGGFGVEAFEPGFWVVEVDGLLDGVDATGWDAFGSIAFWTISRIAW